MYSQTMFYLGLPTIPWWESVPFGKDAFFKGPCADHILIPQGTTGSSIMS